MNFIVVDVVCAIAIVAGIAIAVKGGGPPSPRAYATRIAGTMLAVFALALGAMVTVFNLG